MEVVFEEEMRELLPPHQPSPTPAATHTKSKLTHSTPSPALIPEYRILAEAQFRSLRRTLMYSVNISVSRLLARMQPDTPPPSPPPSAPPTDDDSPWPAPKRSRRRRDRFRCERAEGSEDDGSGSAASLNMHGVNCSLRRSGSNRDTACQSRGAFAPHVHWACGLGEPTPARRRRRGRSLVPSPTPNHRCSCIESGYRTVPYCQERRPKTGQHAVH